MATVLQHRQMTTVQRTAYTLLVGEFIYDTNLGLIFVGNGTLAGGILVGSPAAVPIVSKAANYSILSGDNGSKFNNIGASGSVVLTLPASAIHLSFSFFVAVAQIFEILAVGSDQIAIAGTLGAAAGNIQSNQLYAYLSLECQFSGIWIVSSINGNWNLT